MTEDGPEYIVVWTCRKALASSLADAGDYKVRMKAAHTLQSQGPPLGARAGLCLQPTSGWSCVCGAYFSVSARLVQAPEAKGQTSISDNVFVMC